MTPVSHADTLLREYVSTDDSNPRMDELRHQRDSLLEDMDQIATAAEIAGLIFWKLQDAGISTMGESLEDLAERLGDMDIDNHSDQYTDLIFHIKMALERIDEITLQEIDQTT